MKKLILPLMAILAMCSCSDDDAPQPQAPTTLVITKADYTTNYSVGGTAYSFYEVNNTAVSIPTAGEDQTWDFSTLAEVGSNLYGGSEFLTPNNATFSTATYSYLGESGYTVGGVGSNNYDATFYVEVSNAGFFNLGFSQDEAATINVPTLGATFVYPAQNRNFTGTAKYPIVLFPAQFGDAPVTYNGITNTSDFTVTAPPFGLDNTPAQTKVTTDVTLEVIGSGTANLKGIGEKRVLVTKNSFTDTFNYFLGGAPASPMLLTTLGLTDGETSSGVTYRFIAEGLGTVGIINVNDAGEVYFATFRKAL